MNYDYWGPGGTPGSSDNAEQPRGGSVRAARERQRAGQSQRNTEPQNLLPQTQYVQPNAPARLQQAPQWMVSEYEDSQNDQRMYVEPQWPLPVPVAQDLRKIPPQRPARGPNMPSIPANLYDNSPVSNFASGDPKGRKVLSPPTYQSQDDEYLTPTYGSSPALGRPLTNSSLASDPSIESIPEFSVPEVQVPPPPRRPQQIGPPPSARRGPSSYYPQFSYVSPIYEETERASVRSFASSNVMPSAVPDFYLEDGEGETPSDEEDEATGGLNNQTLPTDHHDRSSLVRQASIGKRTKPKLTTIKSMDGILGESSPVNRSYMPSFQSPQQLVKPKTSQSQLRDSSVLFDDSSPSSEEQSMRFNNSPIDPRDSRVNQIFGGLEKGGALDPSMAKDVRKSTRGTLADRVGSRRPPRLDVEAVREAEARGSITSLPDLIRRATKLASNLDRGKTASRLGWDWINTGEGEKDRRSGLSGMLSAFPPPGVHTPTSPRTNWPSKNGSHQSLNPHRGYHDSQRPPEKSGRRCCGMPLWGFLLTMLILLLLVAAAVVLPVVLIVLPRQRASGPIVDAGAVANAQCATTKPCSNGGSSTIQQDGSCACLCTNGFTGPRCMTAGDGGCSIIAVGGSKSASVGSQLTSLFVSAGQHYSIPLSQTRLLALFSTLNMTCRSENALVTLPGSPSKRSVVDTEVDTLIPRAASKDRRTPATTTGGVMVASSSDTATPTGPLAPILFTSDASAPGTNATSKEFAKIGILFVLQESQSLDLAVHAQSAVSTYIITATSTGSTMNVARNVTLGNGYFMDLWLWTVTLANGTVYGNGYNGTATTLSLTRPP
ncbi:epidermal growth factor-like type 3 [Venturia nashicola]|uniref:Epidermal growth factor-like type 3 n=1 Tax=Venturia nashicola TaxID=86259 RepID=A0A4Z1NYR6_9PEZI|nr:epidermal growth factor-like type 3 [Venturia nashicola]